jgi:hypothetical protein
MRYGTPTTLHDLEMAMPEGGISGFHGPVGASPGRRRLSPAVVVPAEEIPERLNGRLDQ